MKKTLLELVLIIILCLSLVACNDSKEETLWDNAMYLESTELGTGEKTVDVEVKAESKTITFTLHTDKETLGEALAEQELISGTEGAYGLYVKEVNGIKADYDTNKCYWSITKNSEYMNTGVDKTKISDGEHYEFVYTKS